MNTLPWLKKNSFDKVINRQTFQYQENGENKYVKVPECNWCAMLIPHRDLVWMSFLFLNIYIYITKYMIINVHQCMHVLIMMSKITMETVAVLYNSFLLFEGKRLRNWWSARTQHLEKKIHWKKSLMQELISSLVLRTLMIHTHFWHACTYL